MKRLLTASLATFAISFTLSAFGAEPKEITNSIGMKLMPIPAGSFVIGQDGPAADYNVKKHAAQFDDADWDEKPAHRVKITQPFSIGATEVTQAQFRQFRPKHTGGRGADEDAVSAVTWNDAVAFCEWLSKKEGRTYRLPTEAEWEYACRAGTTTLFHTGHALPAGFHQWPANIGLRDRFFPDEQLPQEFRPKNTKLSLRVAQTPANAWGLYDIHGNVSEWCADWYGPYEAAELLDPLGRVDGDFRVIRGGAHSEQTRLLRSANRTAWLPDTLSERTGFRVVLGELPKSQPLPRPALALHAENVSQSPAKITPLPSDTALFEGPKPFVIIPPNSFGPLFSWHNHNPAIADLAVNAQNPKGSNFPSKGGNFNGAGLFAALSFDEGKTWTHRRLVTPGGKGRTVNGIDRGQFMLSDTRAEPQGYLAATQSRDGRIHLISSKNYYVFNLAWLKDLPPAPQP